MKNKIFLAISLALIAVGAVISYFAKFEVAQISGFAVTMFGAGLACAQLWTSRKEGAKTPLVILSIALIGVGAFLAGFTQIISESQVTTIIGLIFSLILIVAGIITSVVTNAEKK